MSSPGSSPGLRTARVQLERLAYGLALHGPTEDTPALVKALARSSLWLETRSLLREHGFTEAEIAQLMGIHPSGCPCWDCIKRLREKIKAHQRKLQHKHMKGGDAHESRRRTGPG
jgi:hypothetical protein